MPYLPPFPSSAKISLIQETQTQPTSGTIVIPCAQHLSMSDLLAPPKLMNLSQGLNYPPSHMSLSITYVLVVCLSLQHRLSGLPKKGIHSSFSKCFLGILETKQYKYVELKETKHMQTVKLREKWKNVFSTIS